MKKKMLYVFSLVAYLLAACTVLSQKIEREMATQVQVVERRPIHESNIGSSITADPLFYVDGVMQLYEVVEGEGWSEGLRLSLVPEERWEYVRSMRDFLRFAGGRVYLFVEHASRTPSHGSPVRVVETFEAGRDRYLLFCPEGVPETLALPENWRVESQKDGILLLEVQDGLFPFFEHRVKFAAGIAASESTRFISLTEAEVFLEQLPAAALAGALSLLPLLLWLFSGWLLRDPEKYRFSLLMNLGITAASLGALHWSLRRIDFPASMLPAENIFVWSHYRQVYGQVFAAMEAFGDTSLWEVAQRVKGQALELWMTAGFAVAAVAALELAVTWAVIWLRSWHSRRYRGKYLAPPAKKRSKHKKDR